MDDAPTTYAVDGLTCQHCASAVTAELSALQGVSAVEVDLSPGGTSAVRVHAAGPLDPGTVRAALAEAGDYTLR